MISFRRMPSSDDPLSIMPKPITPSSGMGPGTVPDAGADVPQFETGEYAPPAGTDVCKLCRQPIAGQYYRVNGNMACPSCADQARRNATPDSHSAFMRALLFGAGAAVVGLIGYAIVGIVTGLNIGFVSLAVGYIIGKAMMKGSNGIGGRRYRIAAVLLTYAAVSVSAIPIGLYEMGKEKPKVQQTQQRSADSPAGPGQQEPEAKKMGIGQALAMLILLGLASPFLELQDPLHGLIGLVILFVGMQIAWRITAGQPQAVVDGPF